jgi:uncharacterized protein (TIGR01777 family)
MRSMRVAITGASGFIGRRLAVLLDEEGHEVHVLGRAPRTGLPPSVKFFIWDPNAGTPPEESFARVDAIIHLAGEPVSQRWNPEVKRRIRSSRVDGTNHLIERLAAMQTPPSVLVSASAVGYYGDRGDEVLTESSSAGNGFLSEVCAEWEASASKAESLGIRTVIPRIGVVLASEGGALAKMLPPFKLGVGGPIGKGAQWMSWIHRDDLARLLMFAAATPALRGPVNATAPDPVTNANFTRALGRALQRPAVLPTPLFAVRLLFGEMSEIITASQRALPRAAQAAGFDFKHPEVFAALRDALA